MSKEEVLNQVYIRELPLIIQRISRKKIDDQKNRLFDYMMNLNISSATAGMVPSVNSIKNMANTINRQLQRLDDRPKVAKFDENGFNKLKISISDRKTARR